MPTNYYCPPPQKKKKITFQHHCNDAKAKTAFLADLLALQKGLVEVHIKNSRPHF